MVGNRRSGHGRVRPVTPLAVTKNMTIKHGTPTAYTHHRCRGRHAGSEVLVRFLLADQDPDRASQTLQAVLKKVRHRSSEIMGTPEILEAHSLQPPEPLEMDPGNPVAAMWRELRMLPGGKNRGA